MKFGCSLRAIDIHSHYYREPQPPEQKLIYNADIDFLKTEYDNVGIRAGAFSSFESLLKTDGIIGENEWLRKKSEENGWVYQWAVIHPSQPETFEQAEMLLKNRKCLGIKIHPGYYGYGIKEFGDRIFRFAAEHRAVVLMHPDRIPLMPDFADRYPDMKLIIAHLGSLDHIEALTYSHSSRSGILG